MKRLISLLLAVFMLVTSISSVDLKAENIKNYVLNDGSGDHGFDDAESLVNYMNDASKFDSSKNYTLTLNADLILPVDNAGKLKTLELRGNTTVIGNGKDKTIIKGAEGGQEGDRLIKIASNANANIKNLKFDGLNEGSKKYSGIDSTLDSPNASASLSIENCEFNSCSSIGTGYVATSDGGAICAYATELTIKDSKFISCEAANSGGAIKLEKSNFTIDGSEFNKCKSKKEGGAISASASGINTINKSRFIKNEALDAYAGGGAISFGGDNKSTEKLVVKDTKFISNKSPRGGAMSVISANVDLSSVIFEKNEAISVDNNLNVADEELGGGAIYTKLDSTALNIDSCKFILNKSVTYGGAIRIFDTFEPYKFGSMVADNFKITNTIFKDNKSDLGFYNPAEYIVIPDNWRAYQNPYLLIKPDLYNQNQEYYEGAFKKCEKILDDVGRVTEIKCYYNIILDQFRQSSNSLAGKLVYNNKGKWVNVENLLNNYDISFANVDITMTYDSNNGSGDLYVKKSTDEENNIDEPKASKQNIKVKTLKEVGFKNNSKFLGWNTKKDKSGDWYYGGEEINDHYGNFYLYAIWEKTPVTHITLTLDENYPSGKITDHEVYEGDLIKSYLYIPRRRGYIFKGWSYDRKYLDRVNADDIINGSTIVYAIWDKEQEEEPEEIKGKEHKAYIFGYPNGTVRPNGNITRAEAAAMLARLLNIEAIGSSAKPNFKDTESSWYNKAINAVVARGIMKGYPDGRFRPNAPITRAEFTQMISTIDNKPYGTAPFVDVKGHWAERAIGSEYQAKRIAGYPDGLFRPDANITRAEAAVILNKIFERNFDNLSLLKCKNILLLKRFIDLDETFWGYNDMVEATNTHEYIRRYKGMVQEDWLLIK